MILELLLPGPGALFDWPNAGLHKIGFLLSDCSSVGLALRPVAAVVGVGAAITLSPRRP
jgi:hypothetical protein